MATSEVRGSVPPADLPKQGEPADKVKASREKVHKATEKKWSYWDTACLASQYIGTGLRTLNEKVILPTLEYAGVFSFVFANAIHLSYTKGLASVEATGEALLKHMPKPGSYESELKNRREELYAKSGGLICQEGCVQSARFVIDYIKDTILRAPEFEPARWKPHALYFLTAYSEDKPAELNFFGKLLGYVFDKREKVIAEALELNFLQAFINVIDYLAKIQSENPHILADLLKEVLDETQEQLNKFEKSGAKATDEVDAFHVKIFAQALSTKFLSIAFPHKGNDLINPMPDFISSNSLFWILEKYALPKVIKWSFQKAMSEEVKNKAMLKGLQELRGYLSGKKILDIPASAPKAKKSDYARQAEFNESISSCFIALVHFIDPSFSKYIKRFVEIKEVANDLGPKVVAVLDGINLVKNVNTAVEKALPILEPKERLKTVAELQASKVEKARKNEEVKRAIEHEVDILAKDISGVPKAAKKYLTAKAKKKITEKGGLFSNLVSKIRYRLKVIVIAVEIAALKLGMKIFGVKTQLKKTTKAAHERLKDLPTSQAAHGVTDLIQKKISKG